MKLATLEHVEKEAHRFLEKLQAVKEIEQENVRRIVEANMKASGYAYEQTGTRKHGAMRRAAHDLKEALTLITQNRDLD